VEIDLALNWERVKKHKRRLSDQYIQALADVMFARREDWLAERLRQKDDPALAIKFLGCLGRGGGPKAIALLLKCLEEQGEALQLAAVAALRECPLGAQKEALIRIMLKQGVAAAKAGEVLASFGQEGRDALWRLWFAPDGSAALRAQILRLFCAGGDARSGDLAFLALNSEEVELIRAGLKAAEELGLKGLWGNALLCVGHENWRIRGRAAAALGKLGERKALPYLAALAADSDEWVEEERRQAIKALSD
jgi:HEAT repeat protein